MVSAAGSAQVGGSEYAYDGDGRRVKKTSGSDVTIFVYDAGGALVAEYGGAQRQTGGLSFLTQDALGSTRIVTGQGGEVKSRHDYLPFGAEVNAIQLPNTGRESFTSYNYGAVRQKFTGYERDTETNLEYAQARYLSSSQGRFTSVDPLMASAKAGRPQSWNRYAYTLNNPLLFVDPNGLVWGYKWINNGEARQYDWYPDENNIPKDVTVLKNREDFYVEGEVNGRLVGVRFNPDGPKSWFKVVLELDSGFALIGQHGDYYEKGYDIVPTRAQYAAYMRTGAVEPDYAFQFGATGLFAGGLSAASTAGRTAANRAIFGQSTGRYVFTDGLEEFATAKAIEEGGRTLCMTRAGRILSMGQGRLPDWVMRPLWGWSSRRWAGGASGEAPFFYRGFPPRKATLFVTNYPISTATLTCRESHHVRGRKILATEIREDAMDFEVEIKRTGRGGPIEYKEGGKRLRFRWDSNSEGAEIYVPAPYEWDAFCEEQAAAWAKGRRQELLERVAREYCHQRAKKAKWKVSDHWILISFENYRIHSLLNKLLGLNDSQNN